MSILVQDNAAALVRKRGMTPCLYSHGTVVANAYTSEDADYLKGHGFSVQCERRFPGTPDTAVFYECVWYPPAPAKDES